MTRSGFRARSFGLVLAALLVAAALVGSALAQDGAWELGRLQLLADRPASGPLRATLAPGSLASYRFVSAAGVVYAITGPRVGKSSRGSDSPSSSGGQRQRRGKGGGSFTSRMEDRFRRRFDD